MENKNIEEVKEKDEEVMTLAPIKYDVAIESIATLKEEAESLKIDGIQDTDGYKVIHGKRMEARSLRTQVENRRKEYKAQILGYGKVVDEKANNIKLKLEEIEAILKGKTEEIDVEKQKIKDEKERIKREQTQKRLGELIALDKVISFEECATLTDKQYNIFLNNAKIEHQEKVAAKIEEEKATQEAAARLKEQSEAQEKERIKLKEEKEKLEKEKEEILKKQAEEQKRLQKELDEKMEAIESEKKKMAEEKEKMEIENQRIKDASDKKDISESYTHTRPEPDTKSPETGNILEHLIPNASNTDQNTLQSDRDKIIGHALRIMALPKPTIISAKMKEAFAFSVSIVDSEMSKLIKEVEV